MTGRHEYKHYINYIDLLDLRSRLSKVMEMDQHATAKGGYAVRSVYFDNYADKALYEKTNGVDDREKFRMRLYNADPSLILLQKKSKLRGLCYKSSVKISQNCCLEVLNGDYSSLLTSEEPLMIEFYAKLKYQQLRPRTIVEYWREAYKLDAGNVRVTLDHHIRTSNQPERFLSSGYPGFPLVNAYILEVKYDQFLPEVVRAVTALSSRPTVSFSKYAVSRIFQE